MPSPLSSRTPSTIRVRGGALQLVPVALYAIGALVFFRGQISSRFDLGFGDIGDARLVTFLHEHVYRWLTGDGSAFLSPPFFYNQTRTLGYSDAFLLDQIVYAPLRLLGADPLLATSLVPVILSPVAYFFFYLFLRRFDVSVVMASVAALIFTFPNNLYLNSGHLQHFAIYYIPVVAYCGLRAVGELHQHPRRAPLLAAFAAGLYGLTFSTGYYMAWFFGLGLLIFAPIAADLAWPQLQAWWREAPKRVLGLGVAAGVSFAAALSIFAVIYAPVLATGAARDFDEYLFYAPRPVDVVNLGLNNLVWSGLTGSLRLIPDNRLEFGEFSIALTPVVQMLLLVALAHSCLPRFWPADATGRISRALAVASAGVCILFFLLTVEINHRSLFYYVYAVVPGANAIRAGYRGMLVANLFAATAIALTADRLIRIWLREPRASIRRVALTGATALLTLAAIEQVNLSEAANLSRQREHAHFSSLGHAPSACRTFYVAPEVHRADSLVQLDAMMIALSEHLPTINGYSGLSVPGWDFYDTRDEDYEAAAVHWAIMRGIIDGLCRADIETGVWTAVAAERFWICTSGGCLRHISFDRSTDFAIHFETQGNSTSFTDQNWADPEPMGRWTTAAAAALTFSIGAPRDFIFELAAGPLVSPTSPRQSLWVEANHCRVGSIEFDMADGPGLRTLDGAVPAQCVNADGTIVLRIHTDRLRTPQEIGASAADTRRLGVMVNQLTLGEAGPARR